MPPRFRPLQTDYLEQLNAMDADFAAAIEAAGDTADNVAAAAASAASASASAANALENKTAVEAAAEIAADAAATATEQAGIVTSAAATATEQAGLAVAAKEDAEAAAAQFASANQSGLVGHIASGTGAMATTVQAKLRETVSVKDFGAKGDGVTNDTAAIQAANNSGAVSIYFPPGVYCAANLTMTTSWSMAEGAWIKYNGVSYSDFVVKCSGNDLTGNLNIDAGGLAPELGLHIIGARNVLSRVVVKNMTAPAAGNVSVAVKMFGVDNEIGEVVGRSILNTGYANVSCPQLLTLGGGSDGCQIGRVVGRNVTSGVVCAGSGTNSIGSIDLDGATDNGIYNTSGKLSVNNIRYKGQDEPIVVIGGDLNVSTAIVESGFNTAIAVDNCGDVYIGHLILRGGGVEGLFKNRDVNSVKSLTIGRISGEMTGNGLCYMGRGTTGFMTIGEIDLTYYHTAGKAIGSWAYFTSCQGFNISKANIRIVDTTDLLTSSDIFRCYFPTSPSKLSTVGEFNVHIVKADGVTLSDAQFYGQSLIHPNVSISKGLLRTNSGPYLEKIRPDVPNDRLYATVLPTLGTWKRGQVLWRGYPSAAGSPGWVCVAAGTPGTWQLLPAVTS